MVAFCAGMLDAIGVLGLVGLLDIGGHLLKEGSNVELSAYAVNPVCWLTVGLAGTADSLPAEAAVCQQSVVFSTRSSIREQHGISEV